MKTRTETLLTANLSAPLPLPEVEASELKDDEFKAVEVNPFVSSQNHSGRKFTEILKIINSFCANILGENEKPLQPDSARAIDDMPVAAKDVEFVAEKVNVTNYETVESQTPSGKKSAEILRKFN